MSQNCVVFFCCCFVGCRHFFLSKNLIIISSIITVHNHFHRKYSLINYSQQIITIMFSTLK
ncbi:hypothetical protein DERF_001143 [Dermatophagoides farinae]|uniref:Uncharacterized protein n=1 Tax=Dermatophagoides farinae TaxID=6954 RepID=A0A922IBN6_DERFA|nr:hypothetical protein DERF_001143 [Dermatophagoides farinae]